VLRRFATLAATLVVAAVSAAAATAGSGGTGAPVADPAGVYALPPGYTYTDLATPCVTLEVSTESGLTYPMPEDPDGKALFQGPHGETWLLVHHELTEPRPGDFQLDGGKCFVPEQTPGDNDSDGWGSISRLTLAKDGTTVTKAEIITTGLHDLCASAITPWKTYLTNEEFPFLTDPERPPDGERGSGWVWEIDPSTGAQTKLIGMGYFSHEQEAYASNGSWYLSDDRGNAQFMYKFVPNDRRDLTTGRLYGLAFNKASGTGTWVGPLRYKDPEADMIERGHSPAVEGFVKAEGIVATGSSNTLGGNAVYFSESGAGSDPGRIWALDDLGNDGLVTGHVVVAGDWARLGRPDNIRFTDAGDLFIMEDHSANDFRNNPSTGGVNQTWVLPRHQEGSANMILFAQTVDEATGPWFSLDNKLLYLSIQADPPRRSHIIAIRHPGGGFNQPYDR
jgi:secreted PhoX family phosphatase